MRKKIALALVLLLLGGVVAAQPVEPPANDTEGNETENGDRGPPSFVGDLLGGVAGFLGGLLGSLPVPDFVKGMFGAG